MHMRERIVIYSALILLLVVNLSTVLGVGTAEVIASGVLFENDDLGPAASLTLATDDNELVLHNADGRLAWSDREYSRAYSMAFVHVGKAMGPLLEDDEFTEEREELEAELRTDFEELEGRIMAFQQENAGATPNDPNWEQLNRTMQQMMAQREELRQVIAQQMGALHAEQIERAYRDFVAAVEVVAEEQEIDLVLRFIPTADDFNALNPPQAYLASRQRTVIVYPGALDITDAVLDELDVEVE